MKRTHKERKSDKRIDPAIQNARFTRGLTRCIEKTTATVECEMRIEENSTSASESYIHLSRSTHLIYQRLNQF